MPDDFVDEVTPSPDLLDGQVEADGANAEEDLPLLDLDQYGNYRIPIVVDGQEELVPLAEARAAAMRHADYTRKTQEVAQQRQALGWASAIQAALDQDPAGTIQLLSQHYGVQTPQAAPAAPQYPNADPFDDWGDDGWSSKPSAQQLDPRIESALQRIERIEQQARDAQFQAEVGRLQSQYPDFDPTAAVAQAIRMGTPDLEVAYKQLSFDNERAARLRAEEQLAKLTQQRAAKRDAGVVSGGSNPAPSGLDSTGEIRSIADAWAAAKRQLGN